MKSKIQTETELKTQTNSPKRSRFKKWMLNLIAVMFGFIVICGVLGVLDILAQRELKKTGEAHNKLCVWRPGRTKLKNLNVMSIPDDPIGPRRRLEIAFPNLVEDHLPYIFADYFKIFIRKSDIPKFPFHSKMEGVEMTPELVNKLERPIIVCLGGSTTDPLLPCFLSDGITCDASGSWSEELSRIMESKKIRGTVFCGGMSSYKTSHDLLRLLRDVLEIQPDIVISYGGVNDFCLQTHGYHQYGHWQFYSLLNHEYKPSFILPNLVHYVHKVIMPEENQSDKNLPAETFKYWGMKSSLELHEYLIRNWRIMNEICKLQDIRFFGVLQPCIGSTEVTRNNASILTEEIRDYYLTHQFFSLEQLFKCYTQVQPEISKYDFMYDFSNIFDKQSLETVYAYNFYKTKVRDTCHVSQEGNRIVAENMFKMLFGKSDDNE
jgi:hypothetical protein